MTAIATRERPVWANRDRLDFWCLTAAGAMVGLALATLLPLSALQLDAQGLGADSIGLVIALHAFGWVLAVLLCERVTDRIGARQTIQCFGVIAAVTGAFMQYLSGPISIAAALCMLGVSLGVVLNMVETWVNEVIPDEQRGRWLAIHYTVFTLFQLLGPVLLQYVPSDYAYTVSAALMLLAWPVYRILSTRHLGTDDDSSASQTAWLTYLLSSPVIIVGTSLFALFDTIVLSLLPVYGIAQGMSTELALTSASVALAGDTLLEVAIGVLADRLGCATMLAVCASVLMIGSLLLPLCIGSLLWWPILFLVGGAAGGIYVLAMMACGQRFTGKHLLRMTALLGSVWGVASIIGPVVTGLLMTQGSKWSIPIVLFAMAASLLASLAYERRPLFNAPGELWRYRQGQD